MAITNTAPPAAAPIIIQGGPSTKWSEIVVYEFNKNNNNKLSVSNLDWLKTLFDWPHLLIDLHNILTIGRFFTEFFKDNVNLYWSSALLIWWVVGGARGVAILVLDLGYSCYRNMINFPI